MHSSPTKWGRWFRRQAKAVGAISQLHTEPPLDRRSTDRRPLPPQAGGERLPAKPGGLSSYGTQPRTPLHFIQVMD